MKISILFFAGCPNHLPAVALARDVVRDLALDAEIEEIEVCGAEDAMSLRFLGSPSIQVDDVDIEPGTRRRSDFGFACRTYDGAGLPPKDMLVAAVQGDIYSADGGAGGSKAVRVGVGAPLTAAIGSFAAAVVASACCWLPLLFVAFGASAGGLGAMFEKTRPIFLTLAAALLCVGFYFTYFRKERCAPGTACETPNKRLKRFNGIMLSIAASGVAVFALLPSYLGVFMPGSVSNPSVLRSMNMTKIELAIGGMTCEGCAVTLEQELVNVLGVSGATVQFDEKRAVVHFADGAQPVTEALLAAVNNAGYEGSTIVPE